MTFTPRIAICGIHTECSTYTPHTATEKDFTQRTGQVLLERYPWIGAGDRAWSEAVDWVPVFHAAALPGGAVEMATYLKFKEAIVSGLRAALEDGPLDAIYFDIHGAFNTVGMDDTEGDLIKAVREVVGMEPLLGTTMDLHGNISMDLFNLSDQMTCFRLAPHEDTWETRERAARNLCERVLEFGPDCDPAHRRPAKALVHVPVLLPGEMTSTRLEPAKSLYAAIPGIEERPGITDAAIWIGYAWADEPRSKATIVTYGDDQAAVNAGAEELAAHLWRVRKDFEFVAPAAQFDECLAQALTSTQRPFFISDSGDNPGAGGADDVTFTLHALLNTPELTAADSTLHAVHASVVDPECVAALASHAIGDEVTVTVGSKLDTREPGPVTFTGTLAARHTVTEPGSHDTGMTSVRIDVGGLHAFITDKRTQYATLDMYRNLDIEPTEMDIIVVKIGYLEPELHAIADGWLLALTPGGVDQDLLRLDPQRIDRPMFPFDPDMADPDLVAIN